MHLNRKCLMKIIECLQYLGRQGQPFQGHVDDESNFSQLLKLRAKDDPDLTKWMEQRNNKYTSHDIQNKICTIMSHQVLKGIVKEIGGKMFCTIADEYTDLSNKEQLTLCLRWVDDDLEAHEDFLGFYHIPNINADTIVSVMKDILLRLQLSWSNCRGQCYDGANNMLGCKSGVAKQIQDIQPKAHVTHCHGHSLSLSIKDTTKHCKVLTDTMGTAREIVTLIKYSPKRENLLGEIKSNIESDDRGITKLCPTRWTVRATCFKRILENYQALLEEWNICLEDTKLQPDIRGRVIGCQSQMNTFRFFFGLNLGERLFAHTDNLSKTLQKEKICAVSWQRMAKLTIEVLQRLRNDESFESFYAAVLIKSKLHASIAEPVLLRKTRTPRRFEIGEGEGSFPANVTDYYRRLYFEALDLLITAIEERFNQAGFLAYSTMESLLLKSLKSDDVSAEIEYVEANYKDDVNTLFLKAQLPIFKILLNDSEAVCFHDVLKELQKLSAEQKSMIHEVVVICELLNVNPTTSATGERSFSAARRLKTWLRSSMTQTRFNSLAILNIHKDRTDRLNLIHVANEFVGRNDIRKRQFGQFSKLDNNKDV